MSAGTGHAEVSRIREAYSRRESSGCAQLYRAEERGNTLRVEELKRRMQGLLAANVGPDLSGQRILEVGCGTGDWLRQFIACGARPENVYGTDLLPERIEAARIACPQGVHLQCGDASRLDFPDASFDICAQLTVFTSILDPAMKAAIASEIQRVVKPGGWLLWYDYFLDNPWNRDVKGVGKAEVRQLFPGFDCELRKVTVAPPLGRLLGRVSPLAYRAASSVKVFSSHYLGLMKKGPGGTCGVRR